MKVPSFLQPFFPKKEEKMELLANSPVIAFITTKFGFFPRNFTLYDFNLIKQGRYSKTSAEFQKLFPKVIKITRNGLHKDEISLQYRIFNKAEDLVSFWEDKLGIDFVELLGEDFEVWEGWDEQREILELDKIKELLCVTEKS